MTKLRDQVREFMLAINQEVQDKPIEVFYHAVTKLRGRLVIEEAFELLEALYKADSVSCALFTSLKSQTLRQISEGTPYPSMPDVADALADLDYVVEGTRLAFGIDGDPIADAVHTANMLKVSGPTDEYGKRQKPEGWQPPNIRQVLIDQGWIPGGADDI